jgi:CMP-N,N'-diacetyllegionaminic acid synthase
MKDNMTPRILAIIPARGGSKGIPKKNIKPLLGRPLIIWTIEQAQKSECISRVFVSTEDKEIAALAEHNGVEIPFLRPAEFAQDNSPTSEAIIHALDMFEKRGEYYDIVIILEPTSPLRKKDDIDKAIMAFLENSSDSEALVSVGEVQLENPYVMKRIKDNRVIPFLEDDQKFYQRQQLPTIYFPYGVIYLSTVPAFRRCGTFYQKTTLPYKIERWQNYEIDDLYDFYCVEAVLRNKLKEVME